MMEVKIEKVGPYGSCSKCESKYLIGDIMILETVELHYHKNCGES